MKERHINILTLGMWLDGLPEEQRIALTDSFSKVFEIYSKTGKLPLIVEIIDEPIDEDRRKFFDWMQGQIKKEENSLTMSQLNSIVHGFPEETIVMLRKGFTEVLESFIKKGSMPKIIPSSSS